MELSPGSFRTFVVGTSYQLGNLASSASSTIESTIGQRFPLPSAIIHGKKTKRYEYGKVICIFMGCVYIYTILLTFVGPERMGRNFEVEHDSDMVEVAGTTDIAAIVRRGEEHHSGHAGTDGSSDDEKVTRVEGERV